MLYWTSQHLPRFLMTMLASVCHSFWCRFSSTAKLLLYAFSLILLFMFVASQICWSSTALPYSIAVIFIRTNGYTRIILWDKTKIVSSLRLSEKLQCCFLRSPKRDFFLRLSHAHFKIIDKNINILTLISYVMYVFLVLILTLKTNVHLYC